MAILTKTHTVSTIEYEDVSTGLANEDKRRIQNRGADNVYCLTTDGDGMTPLEQQSNIVGTVLEPKEEMSFDFRTNKLWAKVDDNVSPVVLVSDVVV